MHFPLRGKRARSRLVREYSFYSLSLHPRRDEGEKEEEEGEEGDRFFLFSDDREYAGEAFSWLDHKEIISHNRGGDSFRDMQLMSMCRHNIIANSTFSTWAGLLNQNPGRRVVYPDRYTRSGDRRTRDFEGWQAMEVEL